MKHYYLSLFFGIAMAFVPVAASDHEIPSFIQAGQVWASPTASWAHMKNSPVGMHTASTGSFCFIPQPPSPFELRETDVFGTRIATWSVPKDEKMYAFEVFKKVVDSSTPRYRLLRYKYKSTNKVDALLTYVDNQENQLNAILTTGNPHVSTNFFDGSVHAGPASTVRNELQTYYFSVIDSPENANFFDFFDENQGFVITENLYRDLPIHPGELDIAQGLKIRNDKTHEMGTITIQSLFF